MSAQAPERSLSPLPFQLHVLRCPLMNLKIFLFLCGLCCATGLQAQTPTLEFPAPSPGCTIKQRVGLTDIEVVYSRPSMKGRVIFGDVVPYNQVWRTGANASTKVSFSTPVKLAGMDVPAGTYALYTIPGESEWTVILSKDIKSSPFDYRQENDLGRVKVRPVSVTDSIDTFTIEFNHIRDESAVIDIVWDRTVVPLSIQLEVTAKLLPQIEATMSAAGTKPYFQAAGFYFEHGQDLQKALKWVDAAIAQNEAYYIVHLKAKILAKLGEKDAAIAAAKRSTELAAKAKDNTYVRLNEQLIASLR
jgi:hypothetical protein